jgi:ADP-heptose:LPS heptosyltransferase
MIQRLVELIRTPVDVLVAGDFSGSDTAVAGSPFVGQVFEDWRHVRERRYDVVLITHSFGSLVPDFNAYRVISSRDLMQFDPAGDMHESEFNLAFLEAAMGASYAEKDVRGYFFGAFTPRSERNDGLLRIGLHAGSKAGVWAAKRWPGFAALGRELSRRGAQVLSVGIPTEYVEGTLDETGHTIERMAEVISTCDAVVSNDSGIMNIANAIGVPVLAIFGPTNPATRGPLRSANRVLSPPTACAPCEANREYSDRFAQGTCRCVNLIGLSDVLAGLADLGVALPSSWGAAS